MTIKSVLRLCAAACAALFAATVLAQSSAAAARAHDGPRLTMYWQMPLDGARAQPSSYGLRLDSAPLRVAALERLPLFDLQLQAQRSTLRLNGMPAWRLSGSDSIEGSDSSDYRQVSETMSDPSSPGFWIGWSAVTLVVLCATRTGVCKKSSSSTYSPPG